MPRGGRRPGAGAPAGNTNALSTGERSVRVRAILLALLQDDEARAVLLRLGARGRARNAAVRELTLAMARLMREEPLALEARRLLHEAADATLARNDDRNLRRDLAWYERDTGRDAETGEPLQRPRRRTPEERGELPFRVTPAQRRAFLRLRDRMAAQSAALLQAREDDAAARREALRGFVPVHRAYPLNPDDDLVSPQP